MSSLYRKRGKISDPHPEEALLILQEYEEQAEEWHESALEHLRSLVLRGSDLRELLAVAEEVHRVERLSAYLSDLAEAEKERARNMGVQV